MSARARLNNFFECESIIPFWQFIVEHVPLNVKWSPSFFWHQPFGLCARSLKGLSSNRPSQGRYQNQRCCYCLCACLAAWSPHGMYSASFKIESTSRKKSPRIESWICPRFTHGLLNCPDFWRIFFSLIFFLGNNRYQCIADYFVYYRNQVKDGP